MNVYDEVLAHAKIFQLRLMIVRHPHIHNMHNYMPVNLSLHLWFAVVCNTKSQQSFLSNGYYFCVGLHSAVQ